MSALILAMPLAPLRSLLPARWVGMKTEQKGPLMAFAFQTWVRSVTQHRTACAGSMGWVGLFFVLGHLSGAWEPLQRPMEEELFWCFHCQAGTLEGMLPVELLEKDFEKARMAKSRTEHKFEALQYAKGTLRCCHAGPWFDC